MRVCWEDTAGMYYGQVLMCCILSLTGQNLIFLICRWAIWSIKGTSDWHTEVSTDVFSYRYVIAFGGCYYVAVCIYTPPELEVLKGGFYRTKSVLLSETVLITYAVTTDSSYRVVYATNDSGTGTATNCGVCSWPWQMAVGENRLPLFCDSNRCSPFTRTNALSWSASCLLRVTCFNFL